MACVPVAGLTALQAIDNHGKLKTGESVLINGSSGGVGHFAVQIAKARRADHVIAYDKQDIHRHSKKYDLVIDTNGNLKHSDYTRMGKRGVIVGFTSMGNMISVLLANMLSKFPLAQFTAEANLADLKTLADFVKSGEVKPHIEKTYPFDKIPEAIAYIESMRTRGKVAMT